VAVGAEDADKLGQSGSQLGDVAERERTHHQVDVLVRQGKLVKVSLVELAVRDLCPCHREHVRGPADADDRVAQGGQIRRMATSAARGPANRDLRPVDDAED
jgi:hypothetical protein